MAKTCNRTGTSVPLEAESARLHRVLQIIQLIQHQDGWDAKALTLACGVTRRTVYRDLQLLEGASIPFFFDEERRCYRIRADFFMRPIDLTLDEALALVMLGEQIGRSQQIPFTLAAVRAVAKVRGQLPASVRDHFRHLDQHLSIRLGETSASDGVDGLFATIQAAQTRRVCLCCTYDSASHGDGPEFILKPYKLIFEKRAWYVVGHHCGHDEIRCLKLGRFISAKLTDIPFVVPKSFSMEKVRGNAWNMVRGETSYDIEVIFAAQFADNIADTAWHKTQEIDWLEDGSIRFRCKVDGLDEVQWWILARGPHCRVVKPQELAQRVRDLARKTAAQYDE